MYSSWNYELALMLPLRTFPKKRRKKIFLILYYDLLLLSIYFLVCFLIKNPSNFKYHLTKIIQYFLIKLRVSTFRFPS